MRCATRSNSATGDVTGLRHAIHVTALLREQNMEMKISIQICNHNTAYRLFTESLEEMPPGFLKSIDIVGDRLVSKAAQLVQTK